ncbi:uncharacterized protein LOC120781589 [Bactrocera tryoni]|uniref:uncharacterized protein LOC120781589 n=1 Tax=Bactrocera tryoni TaxID=59916 RepID=UPI001A95FD2C|nr:uncharacterized protein LOC120781589 [Bactrocera tryoni]
MSTGAGLLESDAGASSVEGKVLQMCPHFNQLKYIFGKKATSELPFEVVDSGSTSIMNESAASQILEITFSDVCEEIASPIDIENLPPGNVSEAKDFAEKTKNIFQNRLLQNLLLFKSSVGKCLK